MSKNTIQKIMGQNLTKKLRMQKYDEKLKICLKKYLKNLVCNLDDARDDVQKGSIMDILKKMNVKNLHRTGGKEKP